MKQVFSLLVGLLCFSLMAGDVLGQQRLADYQRVVIADDANAVQRAAAGELASYVGRITGQKVETMKTSVFALAKTSGLSFFVGDGAAEMALGKSPKPWKKEEWMLRTVEKGLVLAGSDAVGDPWSITTDAGSMLAVYTLLEDHVGVRWFWPGEFGEHVPSNAAAHLPALDERRVPAFEIRSIKLAYPSTYHTKTFDDAARQWMRRSRLGWVKSAVFGHEGKAAAGYRSPNGKGLRACDDS